MEARKISGIFLFGIGILLLNLQPYLREWLAKQSFALAGYTGMGVILVAVACLVIGGYRLATREKKPGINRDGV